MQPVRRGRQSTRSAVPPATIPICPAAGSCSTAPGISVASGRALSGGTMRSRAPARRRRSAAAGMLDRPAARRCARCRRLPACSRHTTRPGTRAPPARPARRVVVQPVLQRHEQPCPRTTLIQPREAPILIRHAPWVEHREQHLQQVDRQGLVERQRRLEQWQRAGQRLGLFPAAGMEVPGRPPAAPAHAAGRAGAPRRRPPACRPCSSRPRLCCPRRCRWRLPSPAPAGRRRSRSG